MVPAQGLLQVEMGVYQTRTACDVRSILHAIGSDGEVSDRAVSWVRVDEKVMRLILVESLSNAKKYRATSNHLPITLNASLVPKGGRAKNHARECC